MGKTDLIPFKINVPTALHLPEITTQLALRIRPVDKSEYQRMKNEKIDIAMMAEPRIIRRAVKMRMSRQKKKQMQPDSQQNPLNGGKRQKAINA